ncbi:MAG: beta-lactamase family protein, partial [Acidimicrobiia bacterium]|nr:beta-lactamase family protein [Acidimicrobiia bacterium]
MEAQSSLQTAIEAQVGAHVPGLAVVATTSDRVVLSRAWGLADVSSRAAMTVDTVCNWFSMTKPVTATVVAILAERGLLDLDDPVQALYEPFTITRPQSRRRAVTVRHLLSHSSGLANPLPLRWVRRADEPAPARSRFVEHLINKHARLRFEPGRRASYSNLGFLVLGEIIEAVTGQTYEECVEDCLLRPLGMRRTGFTAPAAIPWATPYQRRRTVLNTLLPVLLPRRIIGANEGRYRALDHFYVTGASYGGLIGPSIEAARFLQLHLGDGERDGR